jgi:hypothetical protein
MPESTANLQQSVFKQFYKFLPQQLKRDDRFPPAENTIVLNRKDAVRGAGLQMMLQQQFDELVIEELSSKTTYTNEIDIRISFGYQNAFIVQLARAMSTSQNFARSFVAAIAQAMHKLRGAVVGILKHLKGQLEGRHLTFTSTVYGVVLALNGGGELGRAAWEEFMGSAKASDSFTVPTIPAIALKLKGEDVQVSHDIFSKVLEVAKEAGAVIKSRESDECLIKILNSSGECI